MSYILRDEKSETGKEPYYDVRYKDTNGKWKHAKVSTYKHGKYAELIANYTVENGVRINNWFEEKDDYIVIYTFLKSENKYYEIFVDKDDFDKVKDYYWRVEKNCNEYYALTNIDRNKKIRMHRLIMNALDSDLVVDHIKGNGLDNRKNNLRLTTQNENNKNKVNLAKNNNTGVQGVSRCVSSICYKDGTNKVYYRAFYCKDKKRYTKDFNIRVYGEEKAFELACKARKEFEDNK